MQVHIPCMCTLCHTQTCSHSWYRNIITLCSSIHECFHTRSNRSTSDFLLKPYKSQVISVSASKTQVQKNWCLEVHILFIHKPKYGLLQCREWRPGGTYFICRPVTELLKQIVFFCQRPKDKNTSLQADWSPFPELLWGSSSSTKFPVRRHFVWKIPMLLPQPQSDSSGSCRNSGTHLRLLFIHG